MTAKHYIYLANSTNVKLESLSSALDGSFVNDATVTITIKDSLGNQVSGEIWPLSMTYVTASDGDYLGQLSHALVLEDGGDYTATINVVLTDGSQAEWIEPIEALIRSRESQLNKWWPK